MISSSSFARAALSIASGLALALAFPKIDLSLFAWVAFIPLFYAIDGESLWRVFGWAWLAGFSFFVGSMYWIAIPLHDFADVRMSIAILPMLLLAGILAIYSAIAVWAGEFSARRLRIPMVVTMPIAWTAVEWVRTYFPIGFPWNLVGYAAYTHLTLIQFAEFTGVYGISALIVFFNAVVYVVLFRRDRPRMQVLSLSSLTVLMLILWGFGNFRLWQLKHATPQGSLRVAMVQGNIPQSLKWDPNFLPQSFQVYQELSVAAAKRGVDLIVWPEAAAAFFFQPDDRYPPEFTADAEYREALLKLATTLGDPILFGAPALTARDGHLGFFNRADLVSGQGEVVAHYDKVNLVPFGEYVPARKVLGYFVNRVIQGFGDLFPGEEQTLFPVKGVELGVLICYESVFPNFTRRLVNEGADVLVNITNDAWYGESSAPFQALAMASMRSVETKVPMIRSANTGISTIINPSGEITARTAIFTRDMEIEDVPWRPVRTVYTIVGDLFSQICFALTLIALLAAWLFPRKPNQLEAVVQQIVAANGSGKRREAS
ncbi:MAG: apolipoprotein N-acyltransferase [Candidatus Binataceae bacterium]